ncbi:MAG: SUMF1/EgtB/PvdO family nonheme iron enzyme [Nitrospinae bacterium]|nr:SUMF1/EgtB/PvdO family nonheme iron enzyme [Nitrospinota bacterium]
MYGLFGNVSAWTEDCANVSNYGHNKTSRPRIEGDCSNRVIRGPSWETGYLFANRFTRFYRNSSSAFNDVGFRVAREIWESEISKN